MNIQLGRELFMFDGFNHWCDTSQKKFKAAKIASSDTVCVDTKGRICTHGAHFMAAAKDAAYPIRVYLVRPD